MVINRTEFGPFRLPH